MKLKILFFALILWLLFFHESTVSYGPGVMAPDDPVQQKLEKTSSFVFKEQIIIPLASFHIEAKVLSVEHYRFDKEATLSPMDLALGWGRMSDEKVLEEIDISQSRRWYRWHTDTLPIPRREIETHSANMHMIPADDEVDSILEKVRKGDIVRLDGMLIQAEEPSGAKWVSSLSRTDTGAHACEVVFVRKAEIVYY